MKPRSTEYLDGFEDGYEDALAGLVSLNDRRRAGALQEEYHAGYSEGYRHGQEEIPE